MLQSPLRTVRYPKTLILGITRSIAAFTPGALASKHYSKQSQAEPGFACPFAFLGIFFFLRILASCTMLGTDSRNYVMQRPTLIQG